MSIEDDGIERLKAALNQAGDRKKCEESRYVMNTQEIEKLKSITAGDLATLGLNEVVYLRRQTEKDQAFWSIYAADGTEMARLGDRPTALAACLQHQLEPLSVH